MSGSRRIVYSVAMSLDGYIAGPAGEADWILVDPEIDFDEIFARFDTLLMGRRTFEPMWRDGHAPMDGKEILVFSRTLRAQDYPGVRVIAESGQEAVRELRDTPGRDIWVFGGGELFRHLLLADLIDRVEVAVIPILLGHGIPLLPTCDRRTQLELTGHRSYGNGTVWIEYDVVRDESSAA